MRQLQTRQPGTVRYVGLTLSPCPEAPHHLGEAATEGVIEIVASGRVRETLFVFPGDRLLAEDGASVGADAQVFAEGHGHNLRAPLAEGETATVRLVNPSSFHRDVHDLTGSSRARAEPASEVERSAIALTTSAGRVVVVELPRGAWLQVDEGATVTPWAVLASVLAYARPRYDVAFGDVAQARAVLDGRVPRQKRVAAIAPCHGRVEAVTDRAVTLRWRGEAPVTVRLPRGAHAVVREGEYVAPGEALTAGWRSHHRLLRVWGEERLVEHLLDELEVSTWPHRMSAPRAYWSLLVRAMFAWRRVVAVGDTGLRRHRVLPREELERVQRETVARGGAPARAVTVMRGLQWIARRRLAARTDGERGLAAE